MKKSQRLLVFAIFLAIAAAAQDNDIQATEDSLMGLQHRWRSSELEGEMPTSRRDRDQKKRVSVPRGAYRIGCVCMDESRSTKRSTGACSGHGGVRYWLYRTLDGDTVRVLTARHETHPQPLDAAEMSSIAETRRRRTEQVTTAVKPGQGLTPVIVSPAPAPLVDADAVPAWLWPVALMVTAAFLYAMLRFVLTWVEKNPELVRNALSDLLRHRKRPATRKSRKNAAPLGLP